MSIGLLICGEPDAEWLAKDTFDHYTVLLNKLFEKLSGYRANLNDPDASLFAAFCARVILENATSVIYGRLDPFRLMAIRGFQSQEGFDHGRPLKAGFRWTGDVIPKEKIEKIWEKETEGHLISRALLSPYWDELFWRPAYTSALTYIEGNDFEKKPMLNSMEPNNFVDRMKSELSRLHSTLSKGVHWDYLTPAAMLDVETLEVALEDAMSYVALLGFTSHFVPTAYGRIEKNRAYEIYNGL